MVPWQIKNQGNVPAGNQADFCFLTPQTVITVQETVMREHLKKYKDPAFTFPTASSWWVLLCQSPLTPVIDYTTTSPLPSRQPTHPHSPAAPQTHTSGDAGSCDHIAFSSVLFARCTQNKPKEFHNQWVFQMRKACFAWRDWSGLCIKFYTAVKVENMLKTCSKSCNRRTMKDFKTLKRQEKEIN